MADFGKMHWSHRKTFKEFLVDFKGKKVGIKWHTVFWQNALETLGKEKFKDCFSGFYGYSGL